MGEREVLAEIDALVQELRLPGRRTALVQSAEAKLSGASPGEKEKFDAVKLAWALLEDEHLDEASVLYERLRALSPSEPYFWTGCGACRLRQGRFEEALPLFSHVIAGNPNDGTALTNRGEALLRLGRHKDALADFKRAVEVTPTKDHPSIELALRMVLAMTASE